MRSTRHTALYTANSPPEPDSPSERAWSGQERREHGERSHPDGEHDAGADGGRVQPARRRSVVPTSVDRRERRRRDPTWARSVDTRAAATANSPARANALRNPDVAEHRLADDRTDADAAVHGDGEVRRGLGPTVGGLRSAMSVIAATNSAASPAPVSPRSTSRTGSESTKPYAEPAAAARAAPPIITARRP